MQIIRYKHNETPPTSSPSLPIIPSLSSLQEGKYYTYKQLCTTLNLPILSGNAKPHQLLELQRWFDYEKVNTKYFIKEIYAEPLSYIPILFSNSKYIADMTEIILSYIYSSHEEVLYLKPSDVYIICGLTNQRYNKYHSNQSSLSKEYGISSTEIMYFFNRTDSYLKGIVKRALDGMKNKNLIQYIDTYVICDKTSSINYELREATDYDRKVIIQIQNKAMKRVGIESESELYSSKQSLRQEYYTAINQFTHEYSPSWQYYYRTYKIFYSYDLLYEVSNTSSHQKQLNLKVFQFLNDQAVKQYKEELKQKPPKEAKDWLLAQQQLTDQLIKLSN